MKRLVLFGVIIFLIIIGGFLVVDKVWLHKIFEIKPGSCLILEEKYCKKIKIIDYNGYKMAVANLPEGTVLFSPVDGYYDNKIVFDPKNDEKYRDLGTIVDSDKLEEKNNKSYSFIYSKLSERTIDSINLIKKGNQIGKINKIKLKNFSDYNFIFYISQILPEKVEGFSQFGSVDDVLLKIFNK